MRFLFRYNKNIFQFFLAAIFSLFAFYISTSSAHAATLYWVGTDGANTNVASNWKTTDPASCGSGDASAAPASTDVATFDPDCDSGAAINATFNVSGIDMQAGYIGTVTQNTGIAVTVGTGNFNQADGTFTGGDSGITISGNFTQSAGAFTSTSGTLTLSSTTTPTFTISGGTFTHNSGTVSWTGTTITVDVNTTLTLNNLTLNGNGNGKAFTVASADTLVVNGTLTLTNATIGGSGGSNIDAKGPISVASTFDGGGGLVVIDGVGAQSFTIPDGAVLPGITLNQASTTIDFAAAANVTMGDASLVIQAGTFTSTSGTLSLSGGGGTAGAHVISGGTFNHNNGTLAFTGGNSSLDVNTSLTLYNVTRNGSGTLTLASADILVISNTLTLTNGNIASTSGAVWQAQGDVTIASTFDGGSGILTFAGTATQTYTDSGGVLPTGTFTVNKASGTVTLASNMTLIGTGQDLTITSGTLQTGKDITSNITVPDILTISSAGILIVQRSSTTSNGAGQTITAGTLTINSGGSLNADSQGFGAATGPGKPSSGVGGGSYGGVGGIISGGTRGVTYGSATNPTSLGSGGTGSGTNGAGGGAIILSVTNTLTVSGTLSANGGANGAAFSTGGSGGSINITAGTLTGAGTIRANGGNSDGNGYGDGGGGRMSVASVTTFSYTGLLQVNPASTSAVVQSPGYSGTINFPTSFNLTVSSSPASGEIQSPLRLGSDGSFNYSFGTVTVNSGAILEVDGNPAMNSNNGGATTISASSMTVTGTLRADGTGFGDGAGPGVSTVSGNQDGAGYGGNGGSGIGGSTTSTTYGSITNPLYIGSGGVHSGSKGGGAVILSISGVLTVNGTISSNGGTAASFSGAGSGGSINITAGTLTGAGTIQANGGTVTDGSSGAGGGGRVAVILTSGSSFGSAIFQAYGDATNATVATHGAAGTVYKRTASQTSTTGDLIIDNNSKTTFSGTDTLISSLVTGTTVGSVTIQNSAKLQMASSTTLTVNGNWTNNTATTLTNGTVVFAGISQTIGGTTLTTFYNLTKSVTAADTLTFTTGLSFVVSNNTTLNGISGNLLSLRSSSAGTQFSLNISNTGTRSIQYVDVKDSNNTNATVYLCAVGCNDSANNTNWDFPWVGTVYTNAGVTNAGAGVTVSLSVNGGSATSGTTDSNGQFTIALSTSAGDVVTIYVDGHASLQAVVVTVSNGHAKTDLKLYKDYLIVRNDNSGSTTNANLDTADNNGDTDITAFYSVAASNLTMGSGKTLLVWSGSTFAPGAAVTASNVVILGTFTMAGNAITVSGSWDATGGSFSATGTGGVTFTGTSVQTITSNSNTFRNITFNGSGGQWNLLDTLRADQALTITTGTLYVNGYGIINTGGTFANNDTLLVQGAETFTGFTNDTDSGTTKFAGTGTYSSLSGLTSFYHITFDGLGGQWSLANNITVNGNLLLTLGTLNTSVSSYGITVVGNWTNAGGTFTKQSSTVTFTGGSVITETGSFHNITVNSSGNTVTLGSALTTSNNLTITAGTLDVTSNNYGINVGSAWSNSGTFTPRSGTVALNGTNQTISGSTTFYNLTKSVTSAATLTITAGTTQTITNIWTANGASGQNLSLRSSVSGSQWTINPQGTRTISFLDVKDSLNSNSSSINCANDCTNSGNNTNWAFPVLLTVYSDGGTTLIGQNKTVALTVNGGTAITATTNSSSQALFSAVIINSGDVVGMWFSNTSEKGVTATVSNGSTLTFDLYQDYLLLQNQSGSGITNANLATVTTGDGTDISAIYTVSGSDLTVQTGKTLSIKSGSTFIPGGKVTTDNLDINGTFTMGANNVTVAGNWDATGGTFTGSNSVIFTTVGAKTLTSNGNSFNNVTYNLASTATLTNADRLTVSGTQTINGSSNGSGTSDATPTPDVSSPTISSIAVTAAETQATITWVTNESATSVIDYGTSSSLGSTKSDSTATIQHATTLSSLTAETTYSYKITSVDSSSNSVSSDVGTFTTLKVGATADTTSPTISGISVTSITSSSAEIDWTTNEDAVGYVNYGESTSYSSGANSGSNSYTKIKSVSATGLAPDTTYHYQIVAIDAAGNLASSTDQTFGTLAEEEEPTAAEVFQEVSSRSSSQAPQITSEAPAVIDITVSSATVTWKTDEKSSSVVYYRILGSSDTPFKVGSLTFVVSHTVPLTALKESTAYEYAVESTDSTGAKTRSKTYQFTTTLTKASDVSIQNIAPVTADFVYLTDSPTQSVIELTNLLTGAKLTISKDDLTLEHKISLQDLDPGTDYQAVILIKGPDGSVERSLAYIFKTREDNLDPLISAIDTRSALVEGQQNIVQTIISWQTNKLTTSQVEYSEGLSKDNNFKFATERNEDYGVRHIVVLPDLHPSTVYQYRVKSVDQGGKVVVSDSRVLLTPQRAVSALDLIINNLQQTFGWINQLRGQ